MSSDGSDTVPGYRHPRRSSRPPRDVEELPEPLVDDSQPLRTHIVELHRDMRAMRNEFTSKQDASRDAIWRLQSTVEGLRTSQDYAFKLMLDQKRKDRLAIGVIGLSILIVLLLRMYSLIGT